MHKHIALSCVGVVTGCATAIYVGPTHTVLQTIAGAGIVAGFMVLIASIAWRLDHGSQ